MQTAQQLLIVLGPLLLLAFVLHYLSRYVRTRAAWVFGMDAYTYFTAPGVMVHELGHAFFCVIFCHRIVRVRLFSPRPDGSLGSVEHAYNRRSVYQQIGNFFIGTGPIWFGTAIIFLLCRYFLGVRGVEPTASVGPGGDLSSFAVLLPAVATAAWESFAALFQPAIVSNWRFWLFAYLVFCIGSHVTLSRPDIAGASRGFFSLVVFLLVVNLLTLWLDRAFSAAACDWLVRGCVTFYAAAVLVIGLNVSLAFLVFMLRQFR